MAEPAGMQPANKGPKACTTCAKAKARCIPGADQGSKCERCQRLGKDCFSRPPAPPRAKKVPKRSRVAELEKRLDELSSQFEGAQPGLVHAASESEASTNGPSQTPGTTNCANKHPEKCDLPMSLEHLFPSPRSEIIETPSWSADALREFDGPWPLPSEAEILLQKFNEIHAPLFPFVIVPKHLAAAELRLQRPFVWKAVMMASSFFDGQKQLQLGFELLADVGKATILDGVKSLELLQGLLLLISWFNYALKSTQLTNLLYLARSMCVNLGSPTACPLMIEDTNYGELEHMRAYAGTYYLNTLVFTTNKKTDAFMNTSQLEAFCRLLETRMEYPSDEYLVKLVKIQMLAQSISLTMSLDPNQPTLQLPLTMAVQTFQEQIDSYKSSLPPHLIGQATLATHTAIAEVLLVDVAISDQHCNSAGITLNERLQLLYSCVRSLRTFASTRYNRPHRSDRLTFLCVNASDLAYSIITGIKLLLVRAPGWNPRSIVEELGLREMIDKEIQELGEFVAQRKGRGVLSRAEGMAPMVDPMEKFHQLLQHSKELVNFQVQRLEMGSDIVKDVSQGWVMEDLDDEVWQNFMNDTSWNMNTDPLLMDLA